MVKMAVKCTVMSANMAAARATTAVVEDEDGVEVRKYDVVIPDEWKSQLAVGRVAIVGAPFYGAGSLSGMLPVIRVRMPLENLTSGALYVKCHYGVRSIEKGLGGTGMGVYYTLGPREKRTVETLVWLRRRGGRAAGVPRWIRPG